VKKVTPDRYVGCLIGGAVGDALGAPIEFKNINEILRKYGDEGITDYVEHKGGIGEFTDDTQMTLFTAEALLRSFNRQTLKGIGGSLNIIAYESYLRWLYSQGFKVNGVNYEKDEYGLLSGWLVNEKVLFKLRDPGNTCLSALRSGQIGEFDKPINNSKGCGTIMRVAPVGLMYYGDRERAFDTACEMSVITHGHPSGYLSAGFFASVIADLAVEVKLMQAIHNAIEILQRKKSHSETMQAVEKALDVFEKTKADQSVLRPGYIETLGGAWVAEEALAVSLYCSLVFENDFKKGTLTSVNHSGDSDSTGAITGNILGLINGVHKIPEHWIRNLKGTKIVKQVAEDLYTRIKGDTYNPDKEWYAKYPGF
jgi:ADP-ribosylglycohydrolase